MLAASAGPAGAKSAAEVFAEVAPSVVVVLALDDNGETVAQGSGVVVGKNEVATNCHVIEDAESVAVRQAADSGGGETYRMDSRILTRDGERDLCLLFVGELSEPPAAPVAAMGAAKSLTVGEDVYAIGAPEGLELSLSRGVVSQLRGGREKVSAPLIQTDAAISPGSSGGGLFNGNAELVGITTFKWKGENLNFAVPAEWVKELRRGSRAQLGDAEKRQGCSAFPNYECVISAALSIVGDVEVFVLIAGAQAESGNFDDAFATAKNINDTYLRSEAFGIIAGAQANLGNADSALSTIRDIDNADFRTRALAAVAGAQAKLGDQQSAQNTIAAALSSAQNIEYAGFRDKALGVVAGAQAKSGDVNGALATAKKIGDADYRARALFFIAEARAELGDADDALAIAQRINNADSRARALISVAKAQTRAEDHQSARETFAAALSASRRIDSASFLAAVLRDIAKAQMRAGYVQDARDTFAAALHTARKIQYRDFRAKSLAAIAEAQAGFGDQWPARDAFAEALSVARHVSNADDRPWVFYAVAEAQANVDDFRGAMKTAMEIQVDGVRARALAVIAKILAMREKN